MRPSLSCAAYPLAMATVRVLLIIAFLQLAFVVLIICPRLDARQQEIAVYVSAAIGAALEVLAVVLAPETPWERLGL